MLTSCLVHRHINLHSHLIFHFSRFPMTEQNTLAHDSIKHLLDGVYALQNFQTSQFESSIIKGINLFNDFIQQNLPFDEYLTPFLEGLHETQLIAGSKENILQSLPQEITTIHSQVGYLFWIGVSRNTRDAITQFIETFYKHLQAHSA